jgi:hypothetical protein
MFRALMRNAGVNPRRWISLWADWRRYRRDVLRFRAMPDAELLPWGKELPILGEWREASGSPGAYFFQDQLVARWILEASPTRHVDIGSRIDGFIGHLSVFREVEVIDIRPLPMKIPRVRFQQLDLMQEIPPEWLGATDSLSCLHTIEHFGLGRYGDPLDPRGHQKGLAQMMQIVSPGGRFYLSTPVGRERLEFNAHRVFAPDTVLSWFSEGWSIEKSAVIDDELRVRESEGADALREAKCDTGVGVVCFKKRSFLGAVSSEQ